MSTYFGFLKKSLCYSIWSICILLLSLFPFLPEYRCECAELSLSNSFFPKIESSRLPIGSSYQDAWQDIEIIILFKFSDFMCMTCLESFLNFSQNLPAWISTEKVWGVVMPAEEDSDVSHERRVGAIEKKIRGFRKANGILFPVYTDRNYIFEDMAEQGSLIIVLDKRRRTLERFMLPLKKSDLETITAILGLKSGDNS